jgi:hypothetical protein
MTDYDRFRRATPEQKPREEFVVWAFVKKRTDVYGLTPGH